MGQNRQGIDAYVATNLLPHVAALIAVVEAGSFTAAGRRAGVDKTQLSRRVKALEDALETRMLQRTTRRLHVTPAGQALIDAVGEPLADVVDALQLAGEPGRVRGRVRIASPPFLARDLWVPVIGQLRSEYPELRPVIRASEVMVDLVEGGFDLAVRVGHMPDSSHVARRLATWRYVLVASPDWVAAHPEVQHPADLAGHWVLYGTVPNAGRWRFERGDEGVEVHMDPDLDFDNAEMIVEALRAGLGVTAAVPFAVERLLESGELVRVLPDWRVGHTLGIFGVTAHRSYLPARVQVVLDAVRERLREREIAWRGWSDG